jgi:DNA-binding GntR family transcriptional regulator
MIVPVERIARATTVRDEVYVRLRAAIGDGSLPAGTPLVSTELADRLGVSRTPVREAIMRLVQDGLAIEGQPGHPVCVRPVDRDEIAAFFEIRAALEELAARMTVLREDEAALAAVIEAEAVLEGEIAAGASAERQQDLNHAFHLALYTASHNPLLEPLVDGLEQMTTRRYLQRLYHRADPLMTIRDHRAIVSALRAGNADAAGQAARRHVEQSAAYLLARLDAGDL